MKAAARPPRRRIQAPSASPPAPPTEKTEFAASSESPISVLVRQLMRLAEHTAEHEHVGRAGAELQHGGEREPARLGAGEALAQRAQAGDEHDRGDDHERRSRPAMSSERRSRDAENSSGSGSASIVDRLEVLDGEARPRAHRERSSSGGEGSARAGAWRHVERACRVLVPDRLARGRDLAVERFERGDVNLREGGEGLDGVA